MQQRHRWSRILGWPNSTTSTKLEWPATITTTIHHNDPQLVNLVDWRSILASLPVWRWGIQQTSSKEGVQRIWLCLRASQMGSMPPTSCQTMRSSWNLQLWRIGNTRTCQLSTHIQSSNRWGLCIDTPAGCCRWSPRLSEQIKICTMLRMNEFRFGNIQNVQQTAALENYTSEIKPFSTYNLLNSLDLFFYWKAY